MASVELIDSAELIDIGVNLTSNRFHQDAEAVLADAARAGVGSVIITGTSVEVSEQALVMARSSLAEQPVELYTTAGVHPHDAKSWGEPSAEALRRLARESQVVALGECGLDFNRNFSSPEDQLRCFEAQLALAAELGKPVFLHQRDAHDAFMPILRRYRDRLASAVVHCFTGTGDELSDYLALDCHIGITGWLCDPKRGAGLRELVGRIPSERLMIETDAPYLLPKTLPEKPKGNRNEPKFLPYVLNTLAQCRGESAQELAPRLNQTTRAFFLLP